MPCQWCSLGLNGWVAVGRSGRSGPASAKLDKGSSDCEEWETSHYGSKSESLASSGRQRQPLSRRDVIAAW